MKPINQMTAALVRCRTSLQHAVRLKAAKIVAGRNPRSTLSVLVAVLALICFRTPASAEGLYTYQAIKSFGSPSPGGYPSGLIQGRDGALYGTAQSGGLGVGTVFKMNPDGTGFTVLQNFDWNIMGAYPQGLLKGSDGALYGMTSMGGSNQEDGFGTVFKLNADGTGFTVLLNCDQTTGHTGNLMWGADDTLYGTASGGSNGYGSVFKMNPNGTGFTVLLNFDASTKGGGLLTQGADRTIYGTSGGGTAGYGTVFKLNPDGSGFTVLHNFDSATTGGRPTGLILGSDGALYGTTSGGGSSGHGTLFKLDPQGIEFTVLLNFDANTTGGYPDGTTLLQGTDGALYGTTYAGGNNNRGTVFKLNTDGTGFIVLRGLAHQGHEGSHPVGLMRGMNGVLYGTTSSGGSNGAGTAFKLNSDGSGFAVLKNFSETADLTESGGQPSAEVLQGADGALYCTAAIGGIYGWGTVCKMNPDGTGFTVLHNFDYNTTGATPYGALIQDADGTLYGTASQGGVSVPRESLAVGTVFKLNPDGSGFSVLYTLDYWGLGISAPVGLIQGTDGTLYGTATYASQDSRGALFKLKPDGSDFSVLRVFSTADGWLGSGLIQGADGWLYGTTVGGGGYGGQSTVFKLLTDGIRSRTLWGFDFDSATVGYPTGCVIQGTDGLLYGATGGGASGGGTVYKLNSNESVNGESGFSIIHDFTYSERGGYRPDAKLLQGRDGSLYGTTTSGGSSGSGTAFKLNPDGSGFGIVHNYLPMTGGGSGLVDGADGALYRTSGGGEFKAGTVYRLIPPLTLSPASVLSGSGAFTLTVDGNCFANGAVVQWNGAELDTTFVSSSQLTASVTSIPATTDLSTALITVRYPDGTISSPVTFVVTAANVTKADSDVAAAGGSASVSTAPVAGGNIAGISATLTNAGDPGPVTVTAAIYNSDPSPGTAFEIDSASGVVGEFMDLQVTGADEADRMSANFYYPANAIESETSPTLKYYDGAAWVDVISSGGEAPAKDPTDNLDGTVSGGRLGVTFDNTSTPKITELGGTYFAVTVPRPPLGFDGFLAPIGGADSSGGSFANPVRTFKAGSTIPVKFKTNRDGTAVVTGVHRLKAVKYSDETTAATPIDATPQGAATSGNQFVLTGHEWHFNLDTNATGLTKGIWQLTATLSDGSQHHVWIQIK